MTQGVQATQAVADFIGQVRLKELPPDVIAVAKRCVIDGLGVMLAGSTTRGSGILRDYVRLSDPGQRCGAAPR